MTSKKERTPVPRMMGAKEAAEALGTSQTNLRTVSGLPEPVQKVGATTLWLESEILEFAAKRAAKRATRVESEASAA